MTVHFKIGPLYLTVDTPVDFPWTEEVRVFRVDHVPADAAPVRCTLEFTDAFQPLWGNILYRGPQMLVMDMQGMEHRVHLLPGCGEPFALYRREDERRIRLIIDRRAEKAVKWDRNLLGFLSLEHDCLEWDAFLLHASFVIHDGRAIVFTAPSGTGKSTQAELWAAHAGAEIVNGDRTMLFRKEGQWFAGGFPVCGSSPYCENRTAPLQAVVCLEKAPENRAVRLDPRQAVRQVYSQAFVNRWNPGDCQRICDMMIGLALEGRVYHYACTKEPDAVPHLMGTIFPEHENRKQETL